MTEAGLEPTLFYSKAHIIQGSFERLPLNDSCQAGVTLGRKGLCLLSSNRENGEKITSSQIVSVFLPLLCVCVSGIVSPWLL
jgi:hypothetical protein